MLKIKIRIRRGFTGIEVVSDNSAHPGPSHHGEKSQVVVQIKNALHDLIVGNIASDISELSRLAEDVQVFIDPPECGEELIHLRRGAHFVRQV